MYSIQISNQNGTPHDLSYFDYTYTYGDSYTDNGDGTYTINNPTTINRKDWYTVYSNVGENKYVCKDAVNDTCSELWYTTTSTKTSMYYTIVKNYKYANGYTWDGSKYILDNDTAEFFRFCVFGKKKSSNICSLRCTFLYPLFYGIFIRNK